MVNLVMVLLWEKNLCVSIKDESGSIISDIVDISAGYAHSLLLKSNGTVLAVAGYNQLGQLGNGTNTDSAHPVDVMHDANSPLTQIVGIALSFYHSVF